MVYPRDQQEVCIDIVLITKNFNLFTIHFTYIEFDTPYKMFIAAVILASKFVEDNNKIAHSIYRLVAPLYSAREINEMERSFLGVVKVNASSLSIKRLQLTNPEFHFCYFSMIYLSILQKYINSWKIIKIPWSWSSVSTRRMIIIIPPFYLICTYYRYVC